jgi:chromosome segregation ATPase
VNNLDKELLKALGDLLDEKLNPIKDDLNVLKDDVKLLKDDVKLLKDDVKLLKDDVKLLKDDVKLLKTQQEESNSILRSLEHKADINKAEHDKLFNDIAKLSGNIEDMRKDLCAVEIVTARNLENIAQLKLVK